MQYPYEGLMVWKGFGSEQSEGPLRSRTVAEVAFAGHDWERERVCSRRYQVRFPYPASRASMIARERSLTCSLAKMFET